MEIIVLLVLVGLWAAIAGMGGKAKRRTRKRISPVTRPNTSHISRRRPSPRRTPPPFDASKSRKVEHTSIIKGRAWVIDGDSIVIDKIQIRLFGIDAPEINHPFGVKSKWEMVRLCKGKLISAKVTAIDTHGRTVAKCYLPDGRDLSAELVKAGLAIDWPKYSGGIYGDLEVSGARKKMWLADARQKGRMHVWEQFEARQAARQKKCD